MTFEFVVFGHMKNGTIEVEASNYQEALTLARSVANPRGLYVLDIEPEPNWQAIEDNRLYEKGERP